MSRVEENARLIFKPDMSMRVNAIECAKVKFLEDISRSLAVIADRDEKDYISEADAYVRDYLLIQWTTHRFNLVENVEDLHDEWIKWLDKNKEETNE